MNIQEINEKHPEHSRTSCSDEVLYNCGWNASGNLYCIRCQCLYELKIQAEAGRAGFIAGYMSTVIFDGDGKENEWAEREAGLYAERVKAGE